MAEKEKIVKKEEALPDGYRLTRDFPEAKPLPEGEYNFTVTECVFRKIPESDRALEHKGAVVKLRITSDDGVRTRYCNGWFDFLPSQESKICEFLRCVGVKKVNEPFDLDGFGDCAGKSGRAYFGLSSDGKYNRVKYFIDPAKRTDSFESDLPLTFDNPELEAMTEERRREYMQMRELFNM